MLREVLARIRGLLRTRRDWHAERDHLRRDVRSAAAVQQRMLPQSPPRLRTLECAGLCHPAQWIGGDAFDYFDVAPDLTALVLSDVAGKGVTAALTMASIHAVMRTEAPRYGARCDDRSRG